MAIVSCYTLVICDIFGTKHSEVGTTSSLACTSICTFGLRVDHKFIIIYLTFIPDNCLFINVGLMSLMTYVGRLPCKKVHYSSPVVKGRL